MWFYWGRYLASEEPADLKRPEDQDRGAPSPRLLSGPEERGKGSSGFFLGCPYDSGWPDRKRGRQTRCSCNSKDYMVDWLFPNNPEWRLGLGDKKLYQQHLKCCSISTIVVIITANRPTKCFFCIISFSPYDVLYHSISILYTEAKISDLPKDRVTEMLTLHYMSTYCFLLLVFQQY